jgi:hypothetical protein
MQFAVQNHTGFKGRSQSKIQVSRLGLQKCITNILIKNRIHVHLDFTTFNAVFALTQKGLIMVTEVTYWHDTEIVQKI